MGIGVAAIRQVHNMMNIGMALALDIIKILPML